MSTIVYLIICSVIIQLVMVTGSNVLAENEIQIKDITIYYDTGEASRIFFEKQLQPFLAKKEDILNRINIKLIPYGKAKHQYDRETKSYVFDCGKMNCPCLKENACLVEESADSKDLQKLIKEVLSVFMKTNNNSGDASDVRCSISKYNSSFDCEVALANFGTETGSVSPAIVHFPAIAIDDDYHPEKSAKFVGNFEKNVKLGFNMGEDGRKNDGTLVKPNVVLAIVMCSIYWFYSQIESTGC